MNLLTQIVEETGKIPLVWAGSTTKMQYLNFGDALSPVMVALCSGRDVERIPSKSLSPRMVAVGTIGHGIEGGSAWIWGCGCSPHKNPVGAGVEKIPYSVPPDTKFEISATRGPLSNRLMSGTTPGPGAVYGDPVWLLPKFYRPNIEKRWDIGVILHLSELSDRDFDVHVQPHFRRYDIPEELSQSVHLINTVTPIDVEALRLKLDEILACRRIVSTSLHGMVIAESYGIPCLYFSPHGTPGLSRVAPDENSGLDTRIIDLYSGLGVNNLPIYRQPRGQVTDWADLMAAIDQAWQPVECREDDLLNAFPLALNLVSAAAGQTVFDHPLLRGLTLQHDVGELNRLERLRAAKAVKTVATTPARPLKPAPAPAPSTVLGLQQQVNTTLEVPLSWVATTRERPYCNLGDSLSPVIVAAMAGLPIRHQSFDDPTERLVAVGTIGHAQRNGVIHFWGTGLDAKRNPVAPADRAYTRPSNTEFVAHAVRGPNTGAILRSQGVAVPPIYGDPVWFLPRLMPTPTAAPTHELGVIVHISELDCVGPEALVKDIFRRYQIPEDLAGSIRIINTWTDASVPSLFAKVDEILTCKRIASTSLHGLVIAETFGRPCVWFATTGRGTAWVELASAGTTVDHRVFDFYAGAGKVDLPVYWQDRAKATDWDDLIRWIDRSWAPLAYDGAALFEAFPVNKAVRFDDQAWNLADDLVSSLRL